MSDVDYFWLLNEDNRVLLDRNPESCLACLSIPHLAGWNFNPADVTTLEIEFEDAIQWDDLDHPLIQALTPGISTDVKVGGQLRVPLVGIPFDQVITCLRIVRDYPNVEDLIDTCEGYFNSDSAPCFMGFNEVELVKSLGKDFRVGKYRPSDIAGFQFLMGYLGALSLATPPRKWNERIIRKLNAGEINPGWLPPFSECGGYLKSVQCVPPHLYQVGGGTDYGSYGDYHEEVEAWSDSYKERYGVYPCLTVDHSICLNKPLTPVEDK